MTTSSPGFQRVTPGPHFHTIPEASEPPMWWSSSGWESNTDTGTPRAAHTLLKFTPAAITRTMTSNAPGSGTSISSSWKASVGSPSRSWRITQAAIVSGSVPGSTSSSDTFVRSTAISESILQVRRWPGMVSLAPGMTRLSTACARIADSTPFNIVVFVAIVANAVVLGLETYDEVDRELGGLLNGLNDLFLAIFVLELVIRIAAFGSRPQDFFKSGWNLFDFVVIAAAFVPGLRENSTLLRLARLGRGLRVVRILPD